MFFTDWKMKILSEPFLKIAIIKNGNGDAQVGENSPRSGSLGLNT